MQFLCCMPAYFAWLPFCCTPKRRFGVVVAWSLGLVLAGITLASFGGTQLPSAQEQLQQCMSQQWDTCPGLQQNVDFYTGTLVAGAVALPFGLLFLVASFWHYRKHMKNAIACPNPNCQQTSFDADRCGACGTELWVYARSCPNCNSSFPASTDRACTNCGHDLQPAWEVAAGQARLSQANGVAQAHEVRTFVRVAI